MTRTFLALAIFSIVAAGCAGAGPATSAPPLEAQGVKETQTAPKLEETTKGDGETFMALGKKMDEYQDLMAVCGSLAQTEENKELKESCDARIDALRQELLDLTNRLQVPPK